MYAEDDALCYQQLSKERTPSGAVKRVPFTSMQFVGPFDETQFVIICTKRSYTFLCESPEMRTKWIKTISMLTGCSASMEVCKHTMQKQRKKARLKRVSSKQSGGAVTGSARPPVLASAPAGSL